MAFDPVVRRTRLAVVVSRESYRAAAFLRAAASLGVEVMVVADHRPALPSPQVVHVDDLAHMGRVDGVVATDDRTVELAARLAAEHRCLGHSATAVAATIDKALLRQRLINAGMRQPLQRPEIGPWVVKPVGRSASEGVTLVGEREALDAVVRWCRQQFGGEPLVEEFVAGPEVIVEGIIVDGALVVAATFDKPGLREGPVFPETMLISPSIYEPEAVDAAAQACRALALTNGPVHVEVFITTDGPVVNEVHARSIGGLCSSAVACDPPLEAAIITAALGRPLELRRHLGATGVYMIPVPRSGHLVAISGAELAREVPGITAVEIGPVGRAVVALPERGEYLGFVLAAASTPAQVAERLTSAVSSLTIDIRPDESGGCRTDGRSESQRLVGG